jgi:hypothetical protein
MKQTSRIQLNRHLMQGLEEWRGTWEERHVQGHGRGRVAQEKEEGREGGRCEGQGEEWRRCGLEEGLHGLEEELHGLELKHEEQLRRRTLWRRWQRPWQPKPSPAA